MSQIGDRQADTGDVAWVCVADAGRARLMLCGVSAERRCTVQQCSEIENAPPKRVRRRSSPRSGWTGGGLDPHNGYADCDRRRFARVLVRWLKHKVNGTGVGRLVIVAPPRFLGALRGARVAHLARTVHERPSDLTHLSAGALARHPVIQELVGLRSPSDAQA